MDDEHEEVVDADTEVDHAGEFSSEEESFDDEPCARGENEAPWADVELDEEHD